MIALLGVLLAGTVAPIGNGNALTLPAARRVLPVVALVRSDRLVAIASRARLRFHLLDHRVLPRAPGARLGRAHLGPGVPAQLRRDAYGGHQRQRRRRRDVCAAAVA